MTLRVALVGCGFIGGVHSLALRGLTDGGLADARVTATFDRDAERSRRLAAAHPGARAVGSVEEAVGASDAVWVCTPTGTHPEVVAATCASGRAVYCEKPLAPTLAAARELAGEVAGAGVVAQVGLVLRSAPVFLRLRDALADEAGCGRPMAAVLRDDQFFPIQGHYNSTWRADPALAGGGTLIEHSIHDLDALAWLLGPVTEVSAGTASFAGHPGVEDAAHVRLTHVSGAVSSLVSVWHGILSRPSTRRLEVFCERRLLWLDDDQVGPLHTEDPDGARDELGPDPAFNELAGRLALPGEWLPEWRLPLAVYARSDLAFLRAVAEGGAPVPGMEEALRAHVLVDAAYRSASSGEAVGVALL